MGASIDAFLDQMNIIVLSDISIDIGIYCFSITYSFLQESSFHTVQVGFFHLHLFRPRLFSMNIEW